MILEMVLLQESQHHFKVVFMVQKSFLDGIFNGSWKYGLKRDEFKNLGDSLKIEHFLDFLVFGLNLDKCARWEVGWKNQLLGL